MTPEPRNTIDESVEHTKINFKEDYPKTQRRCTIGNLGVKLHEEYTAFCVAHTIGQAEGIAALLDFVAQHEDLYAVELKKMRPKKKR